MIVVVVIVVVVVVVVVVLVVVSTTFLTRAYGLQALTGMGGDSAGMGAFTPVEISEDYNLPPETVPAPAADP